MPAEVADLGLGIGGGTVGGGAITFVLMKLLEKKNGNGEIKLEGKMDKVVECLNQVNLTLTKIEGAMSMLSK